MTVLLVASAEDPASTHIKNGLLDLFSWKEEGTFYQTPVYRSNELVMVTIPDKKIRHENIDVEVREQLQIQPRIAIFLSRHRSKVGDPTLTVHPIGNFNKAEFGGRPQTLIPCAPRMMACLLRLIKKHLAQTDLAFQVCYEVTHHGPYLEIPTLFAEVGSTEEQWKQPEPAKVIALALHEMLSHYRYEEEFSTDIPVLVGVGGGHYAPRFTDLVFEKNIAFGHMLPTYHIEESGIDPMMLEKALAATPNVHGAYLNKKALKKSQVRELKNWFSGRGVPVVSSAELPVLL